MVTPCSGGTAGEPVRFMMGCLVQVTLLVSLVLHAICQSQDGYTDENRPYEFGFTIDGEQHRYEKKDEKGIIMGNFGFITADGIYHVTVYATDENGDFKIIEMKNIKVGFPPGKGTTTAPSPAQEIQLNGIMGCSGCRIPQTSSTSSVPRVFPSSKVTPVQKETIRGGLPKMDVTIQPSQFSITTPKNPFGENGFGKSVPPVQPHHESGKGKVNNQGMQQPKTPVSGGIYGPNAIANQVSSETPSVHGQPELTQMEMKILDYMARLYKFNYTLTFHGHEEIGDIGGNKNGSYFANGRDGYQRRVIYVANEFGYQPKITLIKLDADSTPNEKTEKELNELKGSEFIWF